LALLHLIQQLESAAWLWRMESLLERDPQLGEKKRSTSDNLDDRLFTALRFRAYLFLVEMEAWQQFCSELHFDPEALLRDLPGYDTIEYAESTARTLAFTPEEAVAAAHARWGADAEVQTTADALASLRDGLASREHWWA